MRLPDGWELTPWRAAVHRPTATAVIADLHLGYLAARQAGGEAVPDALPGGMNHRLRELAQACGLRRLIIAGDLVERGKVAGAAVEAFVRPWREGGVELHHVAGNHDAGLAPRAGLQCHGERWEWAGADIVHFAQEEPSRFTLMGHLHPVLRDPHRRGQAACFVLQGLRLILPAQSDDAAGVNVLRHPMLKDAEVAALVGGEVLPLGRLGELRRRLRPARVGAAVQPE